MSSSALSSAAQSARSRTSPTRQPTALLAPDLSAFAKALRTQLREHLAAQAGSDDPVPGHVQLLNMLARAAGHPNVQALKARAERMPVDALAAREPQAPLPLTPAATKAAMQFDAKGVLVRWPNKFSVQRLALWGLWLHFDAKRRYTEREVNDLLKAWHSYGDHATLRRELINMRLLGRKSDCSEYWKEPARPDAETRALLQALRARIKTQRSPD
ncbi:DUF2087 domain-containing protein [Piscinibacterium candidicorallinum]|uniref:DUF2087 domain-containing protein n=1 Tax=Piscinibacterium candidicorallinum TaxID=1793872 RepID=A0ABV7H8L9_9BURK